MTQPGTVLRSLNPERDGVTVEQARLAREKFVTDIETYTSEQYPGLAPMVVEDLSGSMSPSAELVLADPGSGLLSEHPVPEGMRYDARKRAIVPNRKTEEGKRVVAGFAPFSYQAPRIGGLGDFARGYESDPSDLPRHERQAYYVGWNYERFTDVDGVVRVFAWTVLGHLDDRAARRAVEGDGESAPAWEVATLSDYHLAREADVSRLAGADHHGASR